MSPSIPYSLKQEFQISSAEVDFQQKLRFSSLINYLVQISFRHAENLNWGIDNLLKHNLVWVLMGVKIQLDKYPNWRDTIFIETWPKGINKLFYLRDFKIYNSNKELIGRATSNWLLIDINKRRPKLQQLDSKVFEKNFNKHAIKELIPKLKTLTTTSKNKKFIVCYSDIDLNQHLTSTRYIDWIFDTYTLSELANKRPKELTINFMKEIVFGQKVIVQSSIIDKNLEIFQFISEDTDTIFFRAELKF